MTVYYKRIVYVFAVVLLIGANCVIVAMVGPSHNSKTAQLGKVYSEQLGVLDSGSVNEVSISLENDRLEQITILDAQTSCGCVKVKSCPAEIAPGQSAPITLAISPQKAGKVNQRVILLTDSSTADHSIFQVEVSATVKGILNSTTSIEFGELSGTGFAERAFNVSAFGFDKVEFSSMKATLDGVDCRVQGDAIRQETAEGEVESVSQRFTVVASAQRLSPGVYKGIVSGTVSCDGREYPTSLPVSLEYLGVANCAPKNLVLGLPDANGGRIDSASIRISPDGAEQKLNLLEASVSCEAAEIALSVIAEASNEMILNVSYNRNEEKQHSISSSIVGKIDEKEIFRIPILVLK